MTRYYIVDVVRRDNQHTDGYLHEDYIFRVAVPDVGEKGFYRDTVSLDSFMHGRRKSSTKDEKKRYTDGACWSPRYLYYARPEDEFNITRNGMNKTFKKFNIGPFKEPKIIDIPSIWLFYKHIGWDYKKRKYNDNVLASV